MTDIRFLKDKKNGVFSLSLSGHAGGGMRGSDPLCAAASILCHTILERALAEEKNRRAAILFLKKEPGEFALVFKSAGEGLEAAFDTVLLGFFILAKFFPENFFIEERSGEKEDPAFAKVESGENPKRHFGETMYDTSEQTMEERKK